MKFKISLLVTIFAAVCLLLPTSANAQAGFGSLAGVVTDSSHAVIANAKVTLTSPDGIARTAITNGAGQYTFTALPVIAGYSITVEAPGFAPAKVLGLSTSVGTTITQNVMLSPGGGNQTVIVSAANVVQVQTDTSSVSELIDNTIWKDSPLEDRTQNAFVYLTAGAAGDGGTGRGAAVSGSRSGTGNFLVEGMDNNDQGQGGAGFTYGGGGAVTTISPDAIQEYRVITHNPSAEYGRAGGFTTDTSLKSGTNHFHGSLFEYNRIQALAANDYFSNLHGVKDSLIRNQFGGSLGGPIYRDRTFFFASVEIHHLRQGSPVTGTVVTKDFLNFVDSGDFEKFQESDPNGLCMKYSEMLTNTATPCPGAFSHAAQLGPVFKKLLAAEPEAFPTGTADPQYDAAGLYTGGVVTYPVPEFAQTTVIQHSPTDQERASFKLDHKLTNNDQLSFAYLLDLENVTVPFGAGGATFGPDEQQIGGSQLFTGNWTHTFSPALQNLFRLGYTRHVSNFTAPNTKGVPMIVTAADPLQEGFGAYSGIPQFFTENEFLYEDMLTKIIGNHNVKLGFRYMRTRNGSSFYNDYYGTLYPWDTESLLTDETFDDEADMVVEGEPTYGSLYEASASIDPTTSAAPNPYRGFRANELSAYIQDDWKVNNRLTLNLGLRWDYFGPPHNAQPGFDSDVYFGTFQAPTPNGNPFLPNAPIVGAIQTAQFQQRNSNIWNKDTNNFGPRLGFAYDPTGHGKFAIRGGFGIGYDRLYNNVYENLRFNPPHFADNAFGYFVNGVTAGALEQPDLVNIPFTANSEFAAYGGKPVPRHIDQRLVTAYYEQANFGFEYQIAKGYVFETNYIGTWGRKLVGLEDVNNFDGRTACPPPTLSAACLAAGFTTPTTARPNRLFNGDNFRTNGFGSNYNGLQASLRKGFSNGFMFLANYTYSKALDEISDVFTVKNGATGITDPDNPSYDYGPADFDVRHLATITLNYESQWKKGNRFLGGFVFSPIISMESGTEFSVTDSNGSYDPNKDGRTGIDRVPYIGQGSISNAITHKTDPAHGYLNSADFAGGANPALGEDKYNPNYACPASLHFGLWCDPPAGRNALTGPGAFNVDLGVSKHILVTEGKQLTLQAAFFNLFNHTNFGNPVSDVNSGEFGKSQGDAGPRVGQLSLRFDF